MKTINRWATTAHSVVLTVLACALVATALATPASSVEVEAAERQTAPAERQTEPSSATQGCTMDSSLRAYTCVSTEGESSGRYVDEAAVVRGGIERQCHYSTRLFVQHNGRVIYEDTQSTLNCAAGRIWIRHHVDRWFPNHSEMCGQFFDENGDQQGGTPCISIHD